MDSDSFRNDESGWSSPPRTVTVAPLPIDPPSIQSSSSHLNGKADPDTKPKSTTRPKNILQFVEQFQHDLDQIKEDYRLQFAGDRAHIEREMRILVEEERLTLRKLSDYLKDQRK